MQKVVNSKQSHLRVGTTMHLKKTLEPAAFCQAKPRQTKLFFFIHGSTVQPNGKADALAVSCLRRQLTLGEETDVG